MVDPAVGTIYATRQDDGSYAVVKVLAVDDRGIHLRSYANRYPTPPTTVPNDLTLGTNIFEIRAARERGEKPTMNVGVGHYPVKREHFARMEPIEIGTATVDESELGGYRQWQRDRGGVFG